MGRPDDPIDRARALRLIEENLTAQEYRAVEDARRALFARAGDDVVCFEVAGGVRRELGWEEIRGVYLGPEDDHLPPLVRANNVHGWNVLPDGETIVDAKADRWPDNAEDVLRVVPPGDPRQDWYYPWGRWEGPLPSERPPARGAGALEGRAAQIWAPGAIPPEVRRLLRGR
jgi:hypothetical protein